MTHADAPIKIAVVEDHEALRDELVGFLGAEAFAVQGLPDGPALSDYLQHDQPHVLVLDLNLPFEDGISICRRVRGAFPEIRIVMLTGRGRGADRTEGYEAGADVYLTKPTRPAEMLAVIRNLYQRYRKSPDEQARWSLEGTRLALVSSHGRLIRLTAGEASLLWALAIAGQVLDHEPLMALLGYDGLEDKVGRSRLEVLISRLRTKLRADESTGLDIRALRGRGYQLTFALACRRPAPRAGPRR
jgi:DNA-binding response OmpR family regulator